MDLLKIIAVCILTITTVGSLAFMVIALVVMERRRKAKEKAELDGQHEGVERLGKAAAKFCLSNDKRIAACGKFMLMSVKGAADALACHVQWRAQSHLNLAVVAFEWGQALEADGKLDTPVGDFTYKLLTGMHLIRGQSHEAGNAELAPLWVGDSPLLLKQCVARAQACSLRQRGYHQDAMNTDAMAAALPHLVEAGRVEDYTVT